MAGQPRGGSEHLLHAVQGARALRMLTWRTPWASGTMQRRSSTWLGSASGRPGSTSSMQQTSSLVRQAF